MSAVVQEKDSVETKLKDFEMSLQKLKDCTYTESAQRQEYELTLRQVQAELRGASLREQVCCISLLCCLKALEPGNMSTLDICLAVLAQNDSRILEVRESGIDRALCCSGGSSIHSQCTDAAAAGEEAQGVFGEALPEDRRGED